MIEPRIRDEQTERDVEALVTLLTNPQPLAGGEMFQHTAVRAARRILASDWYAERIAQARRDGAAGA